MKRSILCLLAVFLVFSLALPVFALSLSGSIVDNANLLNDTERADLEALSAETAEAYGVGLYVVTLEDYTVYNWDLEAAAEAVYEQLGFGIGSDRNGQMLLLSMADRDYIILAHGDAANAAFTDYGKEVLAGSFLDNFAAGDWHGGFADYIAECGFQLKAAANGAPVDIIVDDGDDFGSGSNDPVYVPVRSASPAAKWGVSAVIGLLFGLPIAAIVKGSTMKSVALKTHADDYLEGTAAFRLRQDRFTHITQERRRVADSSDHDRGPGGGHSGGTSINSHGYSSHSGKF